MWLEMISDKLTNIFLLNNIITLEEKTDFTYGIEVSLLFIIDTICLLAIGIITGHLLEIVIFSSSFTPLKMNAGGYHAKTPQGCIVTYIIILYFSIFVTQFFLNHIIFQFSIFIGLFLSFIILYKYAPAESVNKRLTQEIKDHNRKCTFQIFAFQLVVVLISWALSINHYYIYLFVIGIIAQSISLLIKEGGDFDEKTNAYDSI